MIKVIDKLYLREGLGCCIYNRQYFPTHLKQGDLDGACAVYSLMMYLLILNVVTRRQLMDLDGTLKKKDSVRNLFKALFENRGLVRDGFFYRNLQPIINRHISDIATAKAYEDLDDDEILKSIKNYIDGESPMMISVEFRGGAHAMLVVGYEADDAGIFNIFCLDPGYDCAPTSYWNAVIALKQGSGKRYTHKWLTNNLLDSRDVSIREILCIDKN